MIRAASIICITLVSMMPLSAQAITDSIAFDGNAERSFVSAMRLFLAEDYDSSSGVFLEHLQSYPRSHRTTGAYIMGGKALHESRNYRASIRLLKNLIDLYPNSAYVDDAHYTLALDYFSLQRFEDALDELIEVREISNDTTLWRRSEHLADRLATLNLSLERLEDGIRRAPDVVFRVLLSLRLAERVERQGDIRRAVRILDRVAGLNSSIRYVSDVHAVLDRLELGRTLKIGVALPLMLGLVSGILVSIFWRG
jgi:tetratricopeptide (TPR) repeat protein